MIQLHENHRLNTVYLKGIGRPIQKYTLLYSKLPSNTPQIKPGHIKFKPTPFSHIITLQCYVSVKIDLYLFKKLFKTVTPAKQRQYDVKRDKDSTNRDKVFSGKRSSQLTSGVTSKKLIHLKVELRKFE